MKLTDNVIRLDCTKGAYAYAAITKDGVTLIDTGIPGQADAILAELATHNIQPQNIKRILLTHHDVDHIGNAAALQQKTGCEIYIHSDDYPYMMENKKREGIKGLTSKLFKVQKPNEVKRIKSNAIGSFIVIPAHGHTKGHTVYRFENVLFVGDLVRSKNGLPVKSPSIMTFDKRAAVESIRTLSVNKDYILCPAHGEHIKGKVWADFAREAR